MTLSLETCKVDELALGRSWSYDGGRLVVDEEALTSQLLTSHRIIRSLRLHVARPGDCTRIYCCKDVVQPSIKLEGDTPGSGRRRLLEQVAVVTCGPIVGFQEGIIDMSGPAAAYTPFSALNLLALEVEPQASVSPHEHEALLRSLGLEVAQCLAEASLSAPPAHVQTYDWPGLALNPELPRVAYVAMVLSQGLLHDTWVLGENAREGLPKLIDPRIVCDAGIVSGNCVSACDKNTTYHHRNNPVVHRLLAGHGKEWNFVGMVITNQPTRLAEKQASAREAAALAISLAPDGAIVSKEGFGNPDSDFMMILQSLEQAGIATVGITDEFAGDDGGSQSLADTVPEAIAIVSTGNANERLSLPAMARTIGNAPDSERLAGGYAGCLKADGQLEVELQMIMGATNEMGFSRLSARTI